jgi:hypothetical protein
LVGEVKVVEEAGGGGEFKEGWRVKQIKSITQRYLE